MSQSTPTPSPTSSDSSGLSKGASAGIAVGISVVVIVLIAALLWYFSFHDRQSEEDVELPVEPNRSVYRHTEHMGEQSSRPVTGNSAFANTVASSSSPKSATGLNPTGFSPAQQATRAMLSSIRNDDGRNFI